MLWYTCKCSDTEGTVQGSKETLAQGKGLALVNSERRDYDANEETSTSLRDGISNGQVVPVQAGFRASERLTST